MNNHFEVGKLVVMERKLFIIAGYTHDRVILIPAEQSGYVEVVQPYYTQWTKL